MIEEWKTIEGFEDYLISSKGRLRSFKWGKDKILKGSLKKEGYITYSFKNKFKNGTFHAHQLVAMAFLGHKPCGFDLVIDHIDENKLNNDVSNLRIVTNRFNCMRNRNNYKSKFKGVYFKKDRNKWYSGIKINGKVKFLGGFTCEICAHLAYLDAVKKIEVV